MFGEINILQLVSRVPVILLALTVHEYAHGLVAKWYGDQTAERQGRLTLNPIPHLDPIGTLCLFFGPFGWARPVPVNPYNLRRPKQAMIWISLAGPVSNLLQVPLFAGMFHLVTMDGVIRSLPENWALFLIQVSVMGLIINIGLACFNLIPIFPLDGEKVLVGLLPNHLADQVENFRPMAPVLLIALLLISFQTGLISAYIITVARPILHILGVGLNI